MDKPEKRGREEAPENLGWRAGSTLQPKKVKHIEGVSVGSLLPLQAQLYKTQACSSNLL